MLRAWAALWIQAALLSRAAAQYSSDQCSWRGSGLSHESHRRDVEQVYLRCSQGALEWLYPTGAIVVNLRPNTEASSGHGARLHVCIKPRVSSTGSHVYLERSGNLKLLLAEKDQARDAVHCFLLAEGSLFVEAVPKADISRRITAFQYELVSSEGPGAHLYPYLNPASGRCEPCSDEDVLMAVCTSDFAGSGVFQGPARGTDGRSASVWVSLTRLFRQKGPVFSWGGAGGRRWTGRLHVPTPCAVRPGGGEEFLFTGSVHFGEAWLGCAPRYKNFLQTYVRAQRAGANPCHVDTEPHRGHQNRLLHVGTPPGLHKTAPRGGRAVGAAFNLTG